MSHTTSSPFRTPWWRLLCLLVVLLGQSKSAVAQDGEVFAPIRSGTGNWTPVSDGTFEGLNGPLQVNGGFITPGYWYLFTSIGSSGSASASSEAAFQGQRGIKIVPGNFNGPGIALTLGKVMNLPAGVPHVLSGWVRRSSGTSTSASIYLDLWGAVSGFKVPTRARPGWQFVYGTFTPGGAQVGIRLVIDGLVTPSEVVWVDELAITRADQFVPPSPSLGLINVRFGTKDSPPLVGPAAYGESAEDYWNSYSREAVGGGFKVLGSVFPLINAAGSVTSAGLTISNAPGAWSSGHPSNLMSVYLYPLNGGGNITMSVTNLMSGFYDLYLYGHGGPPDEFNTVFSVGATGLDYGTRSTSTNSAWKLGPWVEGLQYVRFTNVFVSSDQPLEIQARPGSAGVACLNGLQIVRTSGDLFTVSPDSTDFTNSLRVIAYADPRVQVRYGVAADPTTNSPVLTGGVDITSSLTLRVQAFTGTTPISPVIVRTYRRIYIYDTNIPSAWRVRYFGEDFRLKPEAANDGDPDGDGATNLEEYLAGTSPVDPLEGFKTAARVVPAISWRSVEGTTYRVLRRDSLSPGDWIEIARVRATTARSEYVDTSVTESPRFYKVEAVR